jgi:hypothetical protein
VKMALISRLSATDTTSSNTGKIVIWVSSASRKAHRYWASPGIRRPTENIGPGGLAERVVLKSKGL